MRKVVTRRQLGFPIVRFFNERLDEDLVEKIDLFMDQWSTIKNRHFKDGKMKVEDLIVWEKRLKDALGFKFKEFVTFIRQEYKK